MAARTCSRVFRSFRAGESKSPRTYKFITKWYRVPFRVFLSIYSVIITPAHRNWSPSRTRTLLYGQHRMQGKLNLKWIGATKREANDHDARALSAVRILARESEEMTRLLESTYFFKKSIGISPWASGAEQNGRASPIVYGL